MTGVTPAERRDWLRLSQSENIGPATFRGLLARYGTAAAALAALPELSRKGGLSRPIRLYGADRAEADLEAAETLGISAVIGIEPDFPQLLRHIDSAPPLLWTIGDRTLANRQAVAIVGARNASAVGAKFTRMLAAELGAAGLTIVSGMARGIDTAAHEASLPTGTVAVLAGGADNIYPPENARLHAAIAERGLIVSEMRPGTVPRAEHFPRRNRIISGLARAVIVVEAALRSGSLITARLAAEQGRDVFAVPGSPLDPRAEGTNRLIRQGATLLTSAADVLETIDYPFNPPPNRLLEPSPADFRGPPEPNENERRHLLGLLSPSPVAVDDLIRESGLGSAAVLGILLELEIGGRVVRQSQGTVSMI